MGKEDGEGEKKDTSGSGGYGKPGSAKRTLSSLNTYIYVGTEVICPSDWQQTENYMVLRAFNTMH